MFEIPQILIGRTQAKIFCGAVVTIENGNIILIQKTEKKHHGRWSLPGGMVEKKESIMAALQKHLQEQIGCVFRLKGLVGVYNWYNEEEKTFEIYCIYHAIEQKGERKSDAPEVMEVKEFSLQEILNMPKESLIKEQFQKIMKDFRRGKLYPLEVVTLL